MRFSLKIALTIALMLCSSVAVDAHAKPEHAKKQQFAVFGDWGRAGGADADLYKPNMYDPTAPNACPKHLTDPFYTSIDPIAPGAGPFQKKADDKCVINACQSLSGDPQENCEGKIQQLQAAYVLDKTCQHTGGCDFVINTGDNFYNDGCNNTANAGGPDCATRFVTDWINVYKTSRTPAIKDLTWYGSVGNHDILGGIQGVDAQIAYSKKHKDWVLPARYYTTRIGSGPTAINLVVVDTNSFIDSYLEAGSAYLVDEEIQQSTTANRNKQLAFLEEALKQANRKSGWTIVLGHHPAFSGDTSYFYDDTTGQAESTAWAKLASLVKEYKPVAYVNGHDHVMCYYKNSNYSTQFFTSGAGSFTEPSDGGWDPTTGKVRPNKPYLKYSNVRMSDGSSWTGNTVISVTATEFKAQIFSAQTGTAESQYMVTCTKDDKRGIGKAFTCKHGSGPAKPAYSQP